MNRTFLEEAISLFLSLSPADGVCKNEACVEHLFFILIFHYWFESRSKLFFFPSYILFIFFYPIDGEDDDDYGVLGHCLFSV